MKSEQSIALHLFVADVLILSIQGVVAMGHTLRRFWVLVGHPEGKKRTTLPSTIDEFEGVSVGYDKTWEIGLV